MNVECAGWWWWRCFCCSSWKNESQHAYIYEYVKMKTKIHCATGFKIFSFVRSFLHRSMLLLLLFLPFEFFGNHKSAIFESLFCFASKWQQESCMERKIGNEKRLNIPKQRLFFFYSSLDTMDFSHSLNQLGLEDTIFWAKQFRGPIFLLRIDYV